MGLTHRPLRTRNTQRGNGGGQAGGQSQTHAIFTESRRRRAARPTPPPVAVTPVSRADTTSAASTVYNVRYHPVSSPTPPVAMPYMEEEGESDRSKELSHEPGRQHTDTADDGGLPTQPTREEPIQIFHGDRRWRNILNPFKRRRASPPREVASAQAEEQPGEEKESDISEEEGDEIHGQEEPGQLQRANHFFPFQRRSGSAHGPDALPVTVIPARSQPHNNTWSPQLFNDSNIFEPAPPRQSNRHRRQHQNPGRSNDPSDRSDLPVRIIPSQTGVAAPWTTTADRDVNYELRYDPEAAALVGPDDYGYFSDTNHMQNVPRSLEEVDSEGTGEPGQSSNEQQPNHHVQDYSTTGSENTSTFRQ